MRDCVGRNINYLRISITDRCNLRCRYCMPEEGIPKKDHEEILSLEEIYEIVRVCAAMGIDKVRITGGEPLIRKGLTDLIHKISALETIKDIALTTNGILLEKYAGELRKAGLKRINLSLDTLDGDKFRDITRGGELTQVLRGMEAAKEEGLLPMKINTVLIGGFNDSEVRDFINLTIHDEIIVRFIELMPIGQAASWSKERFVSNDKIISAMKDLVPVESPDICSPAKYFKLPGSKGSVGFINPISHKFCGDCNRIRLTADGKLKPCLHSNQEIDIRSILRGKEAGKLEAMKGAVEAAILAKPQGHSLEEQETKPIERDMYRIGG